MATPNYDVNYDDRRFTEVEADKKAALNEVDVTYGNMISNSDKYYQAQIDASKQWADKQSQLQQEQTDFTIEQIEQQKDQAQKDYTKEQSGAYVDWQKQSNQYGANAEQMAAHGMTGSGYSESAQVSMYNTYQNRVMTARESYNRAVLNYNNAIKDARLQNNSALAEIAYQALQTQLELSLEGFQYKNSLVIEQANKKLEVENTYYNRYQDVLDQINKENAFNEEVRQYNASLAEERRQYDQNYTMKVKEYEEGIRQFNEEIARLKANDEKEHALEIQKLELQKEQLTEEKRQFDALYGSDGLFDTPEENATEKHNGAKTAVKPAEKWNAFAQEYNTKNIPNAEKDGGVAKDTKKQLSVDRNSLKAIGLGGANADYINKLVRDGYIEEYEEDGKIKYRKTPLGELLM
jgi:hypothetical protein